MPADSPEQVHADLSAAFNRGDVEAFVELYEREAALLVPPLGQEARGEAAIRAAIEPVFATRPVFESQVVDKLESGGLALTHARWRWVATVDGETREESGRGTVVSRRQPGGGWRIALDIPLGSA
jgi:uncharacterized protein (TIGR02246 family)